VAFILTALVSTVSSGCLGFGVGGAAVGGFAAGVATALLRCEIFAPARTKPRDMSSPGQIDCTRANEGSSFISMQGLEEIQGNVRNDVKGKVRNEA
jgi:hypothetical protein